MQADITRRGFLAASSVAAASASATAKPAVLGGSPVRTEPFPSWPVWDQKDESSLLEALRSGRWNRSGQKVSSFESAWTRMTGAQAALCTTSGTTALYTALSGLDIGPGDEVLVAPYTFVATVNVILMHHALPVFVDSDIETFQMDPGKIDPLVNGRTRAILPVHIGGSPADMDNVMAAAHKHKLAVLEDACQAWLAQWRGRNVGLLGDAGCFSFQASKNINCGEGGAIISNNSDLIDRCYTFHGQGRPRKPDAGDFSYQAAGSNFRMTEFQAAVLLSQMTRLEEQSRRREECAKYFTGLLREVPGIEPAREYDGCTRNGLHLYMFRYEQEGFAGLPRAAFLKALRAEGFPVTAGYRPLNKEPFLQQVLGSRHYRAIYSDKRLKQWKEQNQCPANDRLTEQGCWFPQNFLLGGRAAMEQTVEAIRKIQAHAGAIARA
jgi:perosamine synthetase